MVKISVCVFPFFFQACIDESRCRFWTFRRGWRRNCYLKRGEGRGRFNAKFIKVCLMLPTHPTTLDQSRRCRRPPSEPRGPPRRVRLRHRGQRVPLPGRGRERRGRGLPNQEERRTGVPVEGRQERGREAQVRDGVEEGGRDPFGEQILGSVAKMTVLNFANFNDLFR